MKRLGVVWPGILACLFAIRMASAADVMKPVALPSAEGKLVGAAFSPDSSRLAVLRHVAIPSASAQQHVLQIVDLKFDREASHAEVLDGEPADLASTAHFIAYSSDGRYLLLATKGSDFLSILDAASLQSVKRFALHPETEPRTSLGEGHRYFRGVVGLAAASKADVFGVVTHDELQGNEVFVGAFAPGKIIKSWGLGRGRAATQLGQISLSVNAEGTRIAVSVLPNGNSLPKGFDNLRLYNSANGEMVKSIRTDGLIGQIMLLPGDNILASRIDTPGLFSKKACIERWDLNTGSLASQFCDQGRNVSVALGASPSAGRVVGFGSQILKSIEGQVYAASGRVDVWDMRSGSLIASSEEIPRLVSYLQISANAEWVMADQARFQISPAPWERRGERRGALPPQ